MAEELRLDLLGGLHITHAGSPMTRFISSKAPALLCYLAVTGRPHSRAVLAALLWSEMPDERARGNLRAVLTNLRRHLAPYLIITRETIAFDRRSPYWLDVERFEVSLHDALSSDPSQLHDAVALYQGDFLEGFSVRDAPTFEEWALGERERLRQRALHALHELMIYHTTRHEFAAGIDFCTRLLALDPWREDAHRQLMLLLALSGQPTAAMAQYATCRRVLYEELGVEPSDETRRLYEQIRAGTILPAEDGNSAPSTTAARRTPPPHNLPSQYTPFVGREAELIQIAEHLADPTCRLLTLIGPGGMGKTRLALRAAGDRLAMFTHGSYFVPLASVSSPEHIIPAIASALGLTFVGQDDRKAQLLHHLSGKTMLLLLDNFEQLLDGTDLLLEILDAAPGVKLLVTSRERLAVQAEYLLAIEGLPFPDDAADTGGSKHSAMQLFAERARQVQAAFVLSEATMKSVARICQLVEGMPLGIELAAAWVRTHSCDEIAQEIERSLDLLSTSLRDVPARHRSLRAAFVHSWNLLDDEERRIFRQLSVFHDGFRRDAGQAVAGASLTMLTYLVDKSLLRRGASGRYSMHLLVRQYAEERLAEVPEEQAAIRERHAAYYAAVLERHELALKGRQQREALHAIEAEIHNVRAAWGWMVTDGDVPVIEQGLESLGIFYELRSWLQEGEAAMEKARAVLTCRWGGLDQIEGEMAALLGRILAWQGRFCHALARYEHSDQVLHHGLALLRRANARRGLAFCLDNLGNNAGIQGKYTEARQLYEESLALYRELGDRHGMGVALNHLGGVAYDVGDYAETQYLWQASLRLRKEIGDTSGMAHDLSNLGELAFALGEYAEAQRLLEESLRLMREIGDRWKQIHPLYNLGILADRRGRYEEAKRLLEQCLTITSEIGDRKITAMTHIHLGNVALHRGETEAAQRLHSEGLALFQKLGYRRGIAHGLHALGRGAAQQGEYTRAQQLYQESLALFHEISDQHGAALALSGLGDAAGCLGDAVTAEQAFAAALRILVDIQAVPDSLEVIVGLAALEQMIGRDERAMELLAFALHQPAIWHHTRARAEQLQARLAAQCRGALAVGAQARGRATSLEAIRDWLCSD
ncbi:MAG: tetratricopeptide repeat protein [Chloroflexota bacterium]|nr:tetratricopeptide repeat protein [Chloroflexota bacterium]